MTIMNSTRGIPKFLQPPQLRRPVYCFGNSEGIPAFRWYEKDTGKMVVVANQTAGAHLIEKD
jgi:hypothetical protein